MSDLRKLQKQAHATSIEKGWWDGLVSGGIVNSAKLRARPERVAAALLKIVSEAVEATNELDYGRYRMRWEKGSVVKYESTEGWKPEGLPIELADVVLRVFDLAEALGIDLLGAVLEKMRYNATRPYRHGGKLL